MGVKAGDMTLGDEDEKGGWVGRGVVGEQCGRLAERSQEIPRIQMVV